MLAGWLADFWEQCFPSKCVPKYNLGTQVLQAREGGGDAGTPVVRVRGDFKETSLPWAQEAPCRGRDRRGWFHPTL